MVRAPPTNIGYDSSTLPQHASGGRPIKDARVIGHSGAHARIGCTRGSLRVAVCCLPGWLQPCVQCASSATIHQSANLWKMGRGSLEAGGVFAG